MQFLKKRYERPPKVTLLFDLTLHNNRPGPRWFLLPDKIFPSSGGVKNGGVDGIEIFTLSGKGKVIKGRFQGTGGFQALLLSEGATVIIRHFPISVWENLPAGSLEIEVVIAKQLIIGGETAFTWFDGDPTSDLQADVSEDHSKMIRTKNTTNFKEVPVSLVEDQHIKLQIGLSDQEAR
jgi:hypothetical protein